MFRPRPRMEQTVSTRKKKRSHSGHWHAPGKPTKQNLDSTGCIDITLISSSPSISLLSLSSFTPKVAGAAVTTITNPQNLTSLFITHDFGLYPWSFCFMLGICVSR
ncbi:uncharacterized protein N7479_007756 [Penicillium vulpinum]|uniref:uncharacterized protein n=1 Tax=Penicillium vulpinum TaxID=29845 RepID=UPI0025468ED8|nr:uncharacterized protein N7479_007756 [Penicillium vulpinum]KAJ5960606.1 hypothetical protein N7479_007756 [Penicillium vulpinum]